MKIATADEIRGEIARLMDIDKDDVTLRWGSDMFRSAFRVSVGIHHTEIYPFELSDMNKSLGEISDRYLAPVVCELKNLMGRS